MGKKSWSGSGMNIPDHISKSLETIFRVKNTWILWWGSGSGIFFTLDPVSGMEKFGSGIRDKHPGSATLLDIVQWRDFLCHGRSDVCRPFEWQKIFMFSLSLLSFANKCHSKRLQELIKGTVSRDFRLQVFSWISFPPSTSVPLGRFQIFSKIRRDIRTLRCTTGAVNTGSKSKNLQSENYTFF